MIIEQTLFGGVMKELENSTKGLRKCAWTST
jgi:hypothetical protein